MNEHFNELDDKVKLPKVLIFDVLALNNTILTDKPLKYRKKIIAKTLNLKSVVNNSRNEKELTKQEVSIIESGIQLRLKNVSYDEFKD